jgi:hypothetical protein
MPFLLVLDGVLDKRLVRYVSSQCLVAIIRIMNWWRPSCASNTTEPESDVKILRHRFTGSDGRFVGFGTITVLT